MSGLKKYLYEATLPGGIYINGHLFKKVHLAKTDGHLEEFIGGFADHTNLASVVTQVLTNCIHQIGTCKKISSELIGNMQVGDRNYLMLKLREFTLGKKVDAVIKCPNDLCKKKMDISFSLSDIPVKRSNSKSLYHKCRIKDDKALKEDNGNILFEFRLPNGIDQEMMSQKFLTDQKSAILGLFNRCIKSVNGVETNIGKALEKLPDTVLMKLDKKIKQLSPGIEMNIEAMCPECYMKFDFPFNVSQFFIEEMKQNLYQLYRQVHLLAFYYKWTEWDILSMDRNKRMKYAELVNEQIEKTIQFA